MQIEVVLDDAKLARLIETLPEEADKIVRKTAFLIEGEAKQKAPVDTGNLRNSIQTRILGPADASVDVGAGYGFFVEFGTKDQTAQPFMTPAVEEGRKHLETRLETLLRDAQ